MSFLYILVEIENIGNKKTVYVGPFNFSLIAADSQVYEIDASTGVKLDIGQKREFALAISDGKLISIFSQEGTKLVFQAYEDVVVAVPEKALFLPKGSTIGKPIVFDPHLFVFMVLTINPTSESHILNTDVIQLTFTNPLDKDSLKSITITAGSITVAREINDERKVIIWLNNIAPCWQTLNVSKVTDQSGELVKGTATFLFFVDEDRMPPRIIKHPFQGDNTSWGIIQRDIKPESLDSFDLNFSERMDKKSVEVTISPSLNGQSRLEVDWLEEVDITEFDPFTHFVIIRLPQKLAFGTKYTLLVKGKDLAGNQLEEKIEFKTYTPDLTPPRINDAQCSPKNGATGIDPAGYWEGITIAFTESMAEVKVVSTEPEFSFSPELGGNTLKLKFMRYTMSNETKYRIILTGKDGAGNALATTEYSFETMHKEGSGPITPGGPINLVQDADFEKADLAPWRLSPLDTFVVATLTREKGEFLSGLQSLRLDINKKGGGQAVVLSQSPFDFKKGQRLTYTFWARTELGKGISRPAKMIVKHCGLPELVYTSKEITINDKWWTEFKTSFNITTDDSLVGIFVELTDTEGRVWFDHFRLYEGEYQEERIDLFPVAVKPSKKKLSATWATVKSIQ